MNKYETHLKGYGHGLPEGNRLPDILKMISTIKADTILDIGCGDGSISIVLRDALGAKEVHSVELSPEGMQQARQRGVQCHSVDMDKNPLPFSDNSFDFIHAGEVIEHLYDPDRLLDEIYRVLAPNGSCVISTPNLACWRNRILLGLGYQPIHTEASSRESSIGKFLSSKLRAPGCGHIRVMTLGAFKEMLKMHGFRIKQLTGATGTTAPFLPSPARIPLSLIDKASCKLPSMALLVVALIEKNNKT